MTDFPQRTLRKNHRNTMPSRMVFLDTETTKTIIGHQAKHRMKIAWTCYVTRSGLNCKVGETWKFWEKQYPMWKYIEGLAREKTQLYVLAHSIFFDLQSSGFFRYFTQSGWVLDFIYEGGLTYILVIRKEKKTIRLISTTNFFDTTVEKLGAMIGLPKLDVNFDTVSNEDLKVYCRRDVEIIKTVMLQYINFIESNDLGKFSLTRAAQSFAAYRHRFMETKISIHTDRDIVDLEQAAYIGGRCECFRFGIQEGGPFLSLDINSMYPYVMKMFQYPCRLINYRKDPPLNLVREILMKFACVADVHIETDVPVYAVKHEEKVSFPVGSFRTFLCTGGLQEAMNRGHLKKVYRMSVYKKSDLFTGYVDFFHNLRLESKQENNPVYVKMLKLFLNSLYGKFGQWQPETIETEDITFDGYWRMETLDLLTGEMDIEYKLLNKVIRRIGKVPGKNSFIAVAAHVTEFARLLLWWILEDIGIDYVLYCDTDSVKIRAADLHRVRYPQHPSKLGALKIDDRFEFFDIRGAKNYVTEKDRHIKGIPKKAEEISQFLYRYPTFLSQIMHLNQSEDMCQIVEYVERYAPRNYFKGEIGLEGRISPFRLLQPQIPS